MHAVWTCSHARTWTRWDFTGPDDSTFTCLHDARIAVAISEGGADEVGKDGKKMDAEEEDEEARKRAATFSATFSRLRHLAMKNLGMLLGDHHPEVGRGREDQHPPTDQHSDQHASRASPLAFRPSGCFATLPRQEEGEASLLLPPYPPLRPT